MSQNSRAEALKSRWVGEQGRGWLDRAGLGRVQRAESREEIHAKGCLVEGSGVLC